MNSYSKLLLAGLVGAVTAVNANTIVDTYPANSSIIWFGEPDTATYGQTFTVPAVDNVLNNFKFTVRQDSSVAVDFRLYVMAWNGTMATGPVLYQSGIFVTPGIGIDYDVVANPNLSLTPGGSYVAFLNNSLLQGAGAPPIGGYLAMLSRSDANVYGGGLFAFLNNGSNFGQLTTVAWSQNWQGPGYDTAFRAEFSSGQAVPEGGATLGLLGLVLAAETIRRRFAKV